ncbi:MAG: hypothetical protein U0T36_07320 [Saprospiraceae bacterium]
MACLDLFRNIPVETEISSDFPTQSTPENTFNFIESDQKAVENLLPALSKTNMVEWTKKRMDAFVKTIPECRSG